MESVRDMNCFTFTWVIENFSYCWQKQKEFIESPVFTVQQTKWTLHLYPRGGRNADYISYFLHKDSCVPDNIEVTYELQFIAPDNSVLKSSPSTKSNFLNTEKSWGWEEFAKRSNVFIAKKDQFLPSDTLTARCKIWRTDGKVLDSTQVFSRTIIEVHRGSFVWPIENFSDISDQRKSKYTIKPSFNESSAVLELPSTSEQLFDERISINITYSNVKIKFFTFEAFLLNFTKTTTPCGEEEFLVNGRTKADKFTLLLPKIVLKNYTSSDDVLHLNCIYAYSTGIAMERIEKMDFGISFQQSGNQTIESCPKEKKLFYSVSLLDDLRSLYSNEILCDTKLRTKTKTFSAHAAILGARSSVFKAMFTHDMKEKANNSVDILDVDDDTLSRMLLYIYTDILYDMKWEKAADLYAAADKYEILSLKKKCSSLLKTKLCFTNVCQVFVLVDMHEDEDMKRFIKNLF